MDKKFLIPLVLVIGAMVLAALLLMGPGPDPLATPLAQTDETAGAVVVGDADFSAAGDFDEGFDDASAGDVAAASGNAPTASTAAASVASGVASTGAAVVDAGGDSTRAGTSGNGSLLRRGSSGLLAPSGGSGGIGGTRLAQGGSIMSGDLSAGGITAPPSASFIESPEGRQPTIDAIDDAVVTYSPEGLKVLGPLLADPDPAIRAATVEGIIQLGERRGAEVLRRAAQTTRNPKEQARMIQAAEFLELPEYRP